MNLVLISQLSCFQGLCSSWALEPWHLTSAIDLCTFTMLAKGEKITSLFFQCLSRLYRLSPTSICVEKCLREGRNIQRELLKERTLLMRDFLQDHCKLTWLCRLIVHFLIGTWMWNIIFICRSQQQKKKRPPKHTYAWKVPWLNTSVWYSKKYIWHIGNFAKQTCQDSTRSSHSGWFWMNGNQINSFEFH